jgi:ketosteroid isomerase-like protein
MKSARIQATLDCLQKAYATGDLELALSTMAPDVVWDISGPTEVPYTGVFRGHDGFSRFWRLLGETVEIAQARVHDTLYGEDIAVALGGESGRVRANNRPYHYDWAVEYRFDADAKIASMRQYYDPSRILSALADGQVWPKGGAMAPRG